MLNDRREGAKNHRYSPARLVTAHRGIARAGIRPALSYIGRRRRHTEFPGTALAGLSTVATAGVAAVLTSLALIRSTDHSLLRRQRHTAGLAVHDLAGGIDFAKDGSALWGSILANVDGIGRDEADAQSNGE
jgi:hypothetical protein